jgi:hypothetical protein
MGVSVTSTLTTEVAVGVHGEGNGRAGVKVGVGDPRVAGSVGGGKGLIDMYGLINTAMKPITTQTVVRTIRTVRMLTTSLRRPVKLIPGRLSYPSSIMSPPKPFLGYDENLNFACLVLS